MPKLSPSWILKLVMQPPPPLRRPCPQGLETYAIALLDSFTLHLPQWFPSIEPIAPFQLCPPSS